MKIGVIIFTCLMTLVAKGQPANNVFCTKDNRLEIRVFCKDLAALQSEVNADPTASVDHFSNQLNQLDLKNASATFKFITALTSKAAISNSLRDAGQARPDQQL